MQCLKAFLEHVLGIPQGMQCLKAYFAPVLGILNVDALQTPAAGT